MTRVVRLVVPPHANAKTHARVMQRLSKATNEELVQSLVDAKIIDTHGQLTAPYRTKRAGTGGSRRKHTRAVGN